MCRLSAIRIAVFGPSISDLGRAFAVLSGFGYQLAILVTKKDRQQLFSDPMEALSAASSLNNMSRIWFDGPEPKLNNPVAWTSYFEEKPELGAFILATAEIDGEMREPVIGIFESGVTDGGTGIVRLSDHPHDWAPVEYWIQLPSLPRPASSPCDADSASES